MWRDTMRSGRHGYSVRSRAGLRRRRVQKLDPTELRGLAVIEPEQGMSIAMMDDAPPVSNATSMLLTT